MTQKEFKERCSFHQYGRGQNKRNAIFFDWKSGAGFAGFKFMVKTSIQNATRAELFKTLWNWVINEVEPEWWVEYRFAAQDENRFKVPICG